MSYPCTYVHKRSNHRIRFQPSLVFRVQVEVQGVCLSHLFGRLTTVRSSTPFGAVYYQYTFFSLCPFLDQTYISDTEEHTSRLRQQETYRLAFDAGVE